MKQAQLKNMLQLQYDMNAKVNKDWLKAGYPFLRAAVIEGGEAMEHYGWKWWKKQTPDMAQFGIELVDIWHFILSHVIVECRGDGTWASTVIMDQLQSLYLQTGITFDDHYYQLNQLTAPSRLELLIGLAAARRISVPLFGSLLKDAGMSWDDLYTGYVAKNVLNFFRQDHGYKEGTYIKMWSRVPGDGKDLVEDNVVLADVVAAFDATNADLPTLLYDRLKQHYYDMQNYVAAIAPMSA
jgi:dimeric dUTPase (all-alpha-NTP-PPase superfamily)